MATQLAGVLTALAGQSTAVIGTPQAGPVVAVSPGALNFGLVGVGRVKELTLTLENTGGGWVAGVATVPKPFSILASERYAIAAGHSYLLTVRYAPTAEGTNSDVLVISGAAAVPVMGFARRPPQPPGKPRIAATASNHTSTPRARPTKFAEAQTADFIARYYTDETGYCLTPPVMDGSFRSPCDRRRLLKLAGQQPGRELAVIVLTHYPGVDTEEAAKLGWLNDLTALGYRRIVFLRGRNSMQVNGLPVLETPEGSTIAAEK